MIFLFANSSMCHNDVSSRAQDALCSRDVRQSQAFSQTGENTILESDSHFHNPNHSLPLLSSVQWVGRKEERRELQFARAREIVCSSFLLLSPFSEGSWSVTCPQRCKHIRWRCPACYSARKLLLLEKRWLNNKTIYRKPPFTVSSIC